MDMQTNWPNYVHFHFMVLSMSILQELSTDSSQHVRAALASVIMGMAPLLGKVRHFLLIDIVLFRFSTSSN
jgi:hypothetical protein